MAYPDKMNALILGASGGIGAALTAAFEEARELFGVADGASRKAIGLSRREDGLDLTDEDSLRALAAGIADQRFDLIINATGVLAPPGRSPEKSFAAINAAEMAAVLGVNAIGSALAIKHFAPLLVSGRRSVFATLSARVGSIGDNRLGGWMSYRASKAALNQIVRCAAIELARTRPHAVVVAVHPGTIETALTRDHARGRYTATPAACAGQILSMLGALTPADSGGFFAYDGAPIPW